jgi:hypothetical protein
MFKINQRSLVMVTLILIFSFSANAAEYIAGDSYHQDHRSTPRLMFEPTWNGPANLSGQSLAESFLQDRAQLFELTGLDLQLRQFRESLVGNHFAFQQMLHGYPVENGEILISLDKTDGHVYMVYNNTYPLNRAIPDAVNLIGEERAYDLAWERLQVHGELLSTPRIDLAWITDGPDFQLCYRIDLELAAPYGGWHLNVDAISGQIVTVVDARIYRVADDFTTTPVQERIGSWSGPVHDRQDSFARFAATAGTDAREDGQRAQGTGVVFDPDPRATLQDDYLQDGSSASSFTDAYFTRSLLDIEYSGGLYRLNGPWVEIINWDYPNTPPSTTSTGDWTAVRGNNAFNDAMTYFQIDQNQRYMQSLGFSGATGIQEGPIGTDTDGANGADNSYYYSSTNRMAFGHGCVDDSEDADVMLHEYGHAIHYSINSNWGGGDCGAMGEGFGDYWAGSYSYSTPNGQVYHPEWVFSWDGHGAGNQCWSGRMLNKLNLVYNHNTNYGAHQYIPGGISDELWSTPLFQSLITLTGAGQSRESVDQIILQSHFGIGYGPKMRDLANATVAAATALQPGGPHAGIFIQKFAHHGIIDDLTAAPDQTAPVSISLRQNMPNPFNPTTTISFNLPATTEVNLAVYDITGRLVKILEQGSLAAGDHKVSWQGEDHQGNQVSSGVYFYRLDAGDQSLSRKMVLMK